MKTQLLLILMLISAIATTTVFAQNREAEPKPSKYEHPLLKKFKFTEKVPANRLALKTQSETFQLNQVLSEILIDEDEWFPYRKIDHIYQDGRRVETRYSYSDMDEEDWVVDDIELFGYENGRIVSVTFQSVSGGEPVNEYRFLIMYQQSAGSTYIQRVVNQEWSYSSESWVDEDRVTVTVEAGKLTEVLVELWDGDEWSVYERSQYEESGNNLIETTQYYDDFSGTFENEERIVYSNITASELYDLYLEFTDYIDDGSGVFFTERFPDFVLYEWFDENGGEWVASERQTTTPSTEFYNGATSAVNIKYEYYDFGDDVWLDDGQHLIGYADGRVVSAAFSSENYFSEDQGLLMVSRQDFMYDSNDLLVQLLAYRNDFNLFFKSGEEMQLYERSTLSWSGVATSVEPVFTSPMEFRLNAAYPNPFNPSTVIPFQMAAASGVKIEVFDMLGRKVATLVDEFRPAGTHTVRFDGSGLSSGVYMIRMVTPGHQQTRSVTLLK